MDKQQFSQVLREISQQEIPDNMNLWPRIHAQTRQTTRRFVRSRLTWAIVMLLTMFMVVVTAYAVDRLFQIHDPGLKGAEAADLITYLNDTQTLNGVAVTLEYAYADANRITVGYRVTGQIDPYTSYNMTDVTLRDDRGRVFNTLFGREPNILMSDLSEGEEMQPFEARGTVSYDACLIQDNPDSVDLQLTVYLQRVTYVRTDVHALATVAAGTPVPTVLPEQMDATSTAFFATLAPTQTTDAINMNATATQGMIDLATVAPTLTAQAQLPPTPCGMYGSGGGGGSGVAIQRIEEIGPFVFNFSVPFIPAQILSTPMIAQANGVNVRVESASITPSFTRLLVCLESDTITDQFFSEVKAKVQIGEQIIDLNSVAAENESNIGYVGPNAGLALLFPPPWNGSTLGQCNNLLINQSLYNFESWTLILEEFSTRLGGLSYNNDGRDDVKVQIYSGQYVNETLARVQRLLPDYAAQIVFDSQYNSDIVEVIVPSQDFDAARPLLEESIIQRLQGPWEFRFSLLQAG